MEIEIGENLESMITLLIVVPSIAYVVGVFIKNVFN